MSTEQDLMPCPFCGGEPNLTNGDYVHDDLSPMRVVECKSCSAWVRVEDWNSRQQAVQVVPLYPFAAASQADQKVQPVGYTTPGMLQIASGLRHGGRIGVKSEPDERYSVPLYTAVGWVSRTEAESFLAEYHSAVWSAAEDEDSKVAYDEAGRELAKAFLALFAAAPQAERPKPEYGAPYQGAREGMAIWKRRALAAERRIREQDQIIDQLGDALNAENGPVHMGEPVFPKAQQRWLARSAAETDNERGDRDERSDDPLPVIEPKVPDPTENLR